MTGERPLGTRRPPAWLLGLANAPLGLTGGAGLLVIPQLLSARHVPEPQIAGLTTLAIVPTFLAFLAGPILDGRFRRRTYAVAAVFLAAAGTAASVLKSDQIGVLSVTLVLASSGAAINNVAIGAWFGTLLDRSEEATLAAWMTVGNIVGFGLYAAIGVFLIRHLSAPAAAAALGAPVLMPLLIFAATPCPAPEGLRAHESFARFFGDLAAILRRASVVRLGLILALPAASFALTNTLGGLGRDYRASEAFVSLMGGAASTGAGFVGSLLVPALSRRFKAVTLYVAVGLLGAAFTLTFMILPRTPFVFGTAMVGQNLAQSASLALSTAIALQSVESGEDRAATQFGVLLCAAALPIAYMQLIDGNAYGLGGLPGMFLTDGGLGALSCAGILLLLRVWRPRTARPA